MDKLQIAEVFKSNPNAKKVFIAGGMPFLNEHDAINYANTLGKDVEVSEHDAKDYAEKPEVETKVEASKKTKEEKTA